ncbi:MAG: DUF192 domain-containing protein [Bacteroidetes bacterium]|jgi:uncharacterized membrane protein (UPF0127 family)|nr:DUF192 domain-containing protein [Bacteroidota bacterium]
MKIFKFSFLVFLCLFFACKNNKDKTVKPIEITFEKEGELYFIDKNDTIKTIAIELAKSDYEQQTGLMHRSSMEMDQGMLFMYQDERPRPTFYMKNTQIPLDLIYINAEKQIVEINKNAQPYNENPIRAEQPAQYVLEVNAGFVNQYKLSDSLSVEFKILKQ